MPGKIGDQCPKCSSKLTSTIECGTCGIIFDKYFQAEARKRAKAEQEAAKALQSKRRPVLQVAGLVVLLVVASTFYFLGRRVSSSPPGEAAKPANAESAVQAPAPQPASVVNSRGANPGKVSADRAGIQRASHATVTVETSWGLGSGFFISNNSVITNKHVVEFREEDLKKLQQQIAEAKKARDLERAAILELIDVRNRMPDGPNRVQFDQAIRRRGAVLDKFSSELKEKEKYLVQLEEKRSSTNIKIIMADGRECSVSSVITSTNHDLALLKVYTAAAQVLQPGPAGHRLAQGDRVYALGTPKGLMDTLTSGVCSGYRTFSESGEIYLQTDAPINPGNSGGPLIDEHGYVYGVNTMKRLDAEGIGYAIPIEVVFKEFSNSL